MNLFLLLIIFCSTCFAQACSDIGDPKILTVYARYYDQDTPFILWSHLDSDNFIKFINPQPKFSSEEYPSFLVTWSGWPLCEDAVADISFFLEGTEEDVLIINWQQNWNQFHLSTYIDLGESYKLRIDMTPYITTPTILLISFENPQKQSPSTWGIIVGVCLIIITVIISSMYYVKCCYRKITDHQVENETIIPSTYENEENIRPSVTKKNRESIENINKEIKYEKKSNENIFNENNDENITVVNYDIASDINHISHDNKEDLPIITKKKTKSKHRRSSPEKHSRPYRGSSKERSQKKEVKNHDDKYHRSPSPPSSSKDHRSPSPPSSSKDHRSPSPPSSSKDHRSPSPRSSSDYRNMSPSRRKRNPSPSGRLDDRSRSKSPKKGKAQSVLTPPYKPRTPVHFPNKTDTISVSSTIYLNEYGIDKNERFANFSISRVANRLEEMGFSEEIANLFVKHKISGKQLKNITNSDLRDMGITDNTIRNKLLEAKQEFLSELVINV